jgi:hypothetical protein
VVELPHAETTCNTFDQGDQIWRIFRPMGDC